jgi:hypothetical protein
MFDVVENLEETNLPTPEKLPLLTATRGTQPISVEKEPDADQFPASSLS